METKEAMYQKGYRPLSQWKKADFLEEYFMFDQKRLSKYNLETLKDALLVCRGQGYGFPNVVYFYGFDENPIYNATVEEFYTKLDESKAKVEKRNKERKEREKVIIPVVFQYETFDYYKNAWFKHLEYGYLKGDWIYSDATCKRRKKNINSQKVSWVERYKNNNKED